jgi:PAS domain S-box-containing protein
MCGKSNYQISIATVQTSEPAEVETKPAPSKEDGAGLDAMHPGGGGAPAKEVAEHQGREAVLPQPKEWLQGALDAGNVGVWDWNLATGRVEWSESGEWIHGRALAARGSTFEEFLATIHSDDRDRVLTAVQQALRGDGKLQVEYRLLTSGAGAKWIEGKGRAIYDDAHRPIRIVGVCTDVTARKSAEEELRTARDELRAQTGHQMLELLQLNEVLAEKVKLLEIAHDAIIVRSMSAAILLWNQGAELVYGWPAQETLGKITHSLLQTRFPESLEQAEARLFAEGWWEGELVQTRRDGTEITVASRHVLRRNDEGRPVSILEINRDITAQKRAERALAESAERFRLLVEGVKDYAIFSLDSQGNVMSWNQGAERIKGYRAAEIVGKHFSVFYSPDDARAGKPDALLKIAATEGRVEDEGWRVRKDGSRFWADVVITALRDEAGNLRGFSKVTRDVTERRRYEDDLRQLSGRLLRLQDEERRRMARELHDSTAQTLAALSLNLALVKQRAGEFDDPRAAKAWAESMELAGQASREIRTFSYLLHPPMLDEAGLPHALRWYADGFASRTGIRVDVSVSPDLGRLPGDAETALFRIAQECLTNIHRHSGSATAAIVLRVDSGQVILRVADEGKGVPDDVIREGPGNPAPLGVGIRGMRERVRQLGGRLDMRRADPGTIIEVVLPFSGEDR